MTGFVRPDPQAVALPFREAVDFFRRKYNIDSRAWTELWQDEHARGFMVAGARGQVLADFRAAVEKAIAQGATLADFRRDFDKIVATHGWSYKGKRGWRSRVIFDTNLRTAYAAGRWAQIERVKATRPYLRYVAVMDGRTRPDHEKWHDTVLPVDHEFWKTHYPPNGWGCRCTVQSLSARDLERRGLQVSDNPDIGRPEIKTIDSPRGARQVVVYDGVDPGFGYNVGRAGAPNPRERGQPPAPAASAERTEWKRLTPGDWQSAGRPRDIPRDAMPPGLGLGRAAESPDDFVAMIEKKIGGKRAVFELPNGQKLVLSADEIGRHSDPSRARHLDLMIATLQDPFEIWSGFEQDPKSGRVVLRQRIIRAFADIEKMEFMVAETINGELVSYTFIPSPKNYVNKRRWGFLEYARP